MRHPTLSWRPSPSTLNSVEYYESDEFFRHLILGMGFQQKLRLSSLSKGQWTSANKSHLIDSMVADLIEEVDTLAVTQFDPSHKLLVTFFPGSGMDDVPFSNQSDVEDVFAKAFFYADVVGGRTGREYKKLLIEEGADFLGKSSTIFDKFVRNRILQLELQERLDDRAKVLSGYDRTRNARDMLTLPIYYRSRRSLDVIKKSTQSKFSVKWIGMTREEF